MQKKFVKLYENLISRFTNGGFLVGDYVKFVKNYDKNDDFEKLGNNVKDFISEIIQSGQHIRVVGIKDVMPLSRPGNPETRNGNNVTIDIALDNGGGRYSHYCTVPKCCLEVLETDGINYPKIPEKFNFRNIDTELKELETNKPYAQTRPKGFNYELPKK